MVGCHDLSFMPSWPLWPMRVREVGRAIAWLRIVARFKSLTDRPKAQCWVSAEGIPEARRRGWRGLVKRPQRTPPASREKNLAAEKNRTRAAEGVAGGTRCA